MKQIVLVLVTLLLTSCSSTFYYSTLNTKNEYVEKVENGDFLIETDSLWIAHCFKGANAPVQITIFNKLNEPLYVDWQQSALIIDGSAYSYAGNSVTFQGRNSSDNYNTGDGTYTYSFGNFDGEVKMPTHTSFIPPQTMISEIPLHLDPNFKQLDKNIYRSSNIGDKDNQASSAKRADFDEENSPLRFTSYLTLYAKPEKPMVFSQDFYLSNLIKTGLKPNRLAGNMIDRGDFFYIEQQANNNALYTTLGIAALGGLLVVGILYGDENVYSDNYDLDFDFDY
jgi:hypothetical protein